MGNYTSALIISNYEYGDIEKINKQTKLKFNLIDSEKTGFSIHGLYVRQLNQSKIDKLIEVFKETDFKTTECAVLMIDDYYYHSFNKVFLKNNEHDEYNYIPSEYHMILKQKLMKRIVNISDVKGNLIKQTILNNGLVSLFDDGRFAFYEIDDKNNMLSLSGNSLSLSELLQAGVVNQEDLAAEKYYKERLR